MLNSSHTCRECSGRMVKAGEQQACEFGTSPDETGFTVDIYECEECEAVDWE